MQDTIFRLFLSSTFADFQHERRALHQRVFPALDDYARSHGARFEVVDLRWGISREAQEDHRTLTICLDEIRRCRQIGLPPNFAVLLGDRYGWEPPPVAISDATWQRIMSGAGVDAPLIDAHYAPDHNAVPVLWRLRPQDSRRDDADALPSLVGALRRAAVVAGLSPAAHPELFASVTHQEIARGVFTLPPGTADVFAYLREIDDLPFSPQGAPYVDVMAKSWASTAHARLRALKRELTEHLAPGNVRTISTRWLGDDIATDHLAGFCTQFFEDQKSLIDASLATFRTGRSVLAVGELHGGFARQRARLFVGREEQVKQITAYATTTAERGANDEEAAPLLIVGDGGTGKSSLLAESALRISATHDGSVVLVRFIGAVPGSESLTTLLAEAAEALALAYGRAVAPLSADFEAASAGFGRALAYATPEQPLVVLFDALDQLTAADQLHLLDWLPDRLPPAVRMIATTRDGRIAAEARRRFGKNMLHLAPMTAAESTAMLDRLLADAGRTLTTAQRAGIERVSPGLPLWTRLAFEEARHWQSDSPGRSLEPTIEGLILARIAELSAPVAHGRALVADALGAIAASRFGLSDGELAMALSQSCAPQVWAEFRARSFHQWDEPQLPPILWFRLHADLAPYLAEHRIDGTLTYRFFHREFQEVVARQVSGGNEGTAMHRRLAMVFSEPACSGLHVGCDVTHLQEPRALRRIMEQPWQLAAASEYAALAACLADVGFVAAKCAANRVADLMEDVAALSHAGSGSWNDGTARSWFARLLAWRPILNQADRRWPAHRILIQLLLEADGEMAQRAGVLDLLRRHPPDWTILLSTSPQRYVEPLVEMVPAPPRLAGVAPLSSRGVVAWDHQGSLRLIDRMTGAMLERVELGGVEQVARFLVSLAVRLGLRDTPPIFSVADAHDRRRPVAHAVASPSLALSWQWPGCLAVEHARKRTEIIVGKQDVVFLGETAEDLFFLADGNIAAARKQRLAEAEAGLFTFNGQRISGLELDGDTGGWTHERFNSVVFMDNDTCLTFGFSLGGAQRDDVILEIYRVTTSGVRRHAYGRTDHDLDLPIWHVVGLANGSVVFASERYWHTFEWAPPFEGECEVTLIPGAAVGNGALGNWVDVGNPEGHLSFAPTDPSNSVMFDAPGFYGSMGGEFFAPSGITRLDPDDFAYTSADFTGIEVEDAATGVARWVTDVRPHWIFAREGQDFIVFKNSGPVRVVALPQAAPGVCT